LIKDNANQITGVKFRHEKDIIDISCKIVVGADGVESQVGRWAGINTCLSTYDVHTGVQYTVNNIKVEKHLCQFYFGRDIAPNGYLWIFPKSETQANIGIGICGDSTQPGKGPRYYLDNFMNKNYPNASINYMVYGGIPTRAGNDFIRNNIMLVGDAAHQVNPITGGGIVQAMIAAKCCGETAAKAIKENNFSANFLNDYAKRWNAKLGDKQKFLYQLKHKFMKMDDKKFDKLVALCKRIPQEELNLHRLFKETIKEDPLLVAKLASAFVVSKIK
jgi:digeranylgeranylglycerophospholipid reductase